MTITIEQPEDVLTIQDFIAAMTIDKKQTLGMLMDNIKPIQEQKKKSTEEIIISSLYKYKPLNKYVGLEGKVPVRAGTTFVGVEVELERVVMRSDLSGTWNKTVDNSLKDDGVEFITVPLQFKYLEVELQRLFGGIKSCHSSTRCSIHVHINVRDMSLEELASFISLYLIFEKSLFNFSGNRWNNNFCVPLGFYPTAPSKFISSLLKGEIRENWYKYLGLNVSPIFGGESTKLGTIEFRHMVGTTNIDYILQWINLIVSLKISAKKMPFKEVKEHIDVMNTTSGYFWLAEQVFKEYSPLISRQPSFKEDVEGCISRAKLILSQPVKSTKIIKFNLKG